jgi:hypothetical protein
MSIADTPQAARFGWELAVVTQPYFEKCTTKIQGLQLAFFSAVQE